MANTALKRWRQRVSRRLSAALTAAGIDIERTARSQSFSALLQRRLRQVKRERSNFQFVQIGANDGITHDPIHAFVTANRLHGVVVEPLPDVFARLCENYAGQPGVKPLNVAIHCSLPQVTLYRPDPSTASQFSGITSLSADRHELTRKRTGLQTDQILAVEVPAMGINQLLAEHVEGHLDLLQIDAEGYDLEIVDDLKLERYQPSIIRFEHGLYSNAVTREALGSTIMRLFNHGYAIAMERVDATAWRQEDLAQRR